MLKNQITKGDVLTKLLTKVTYETFEQSPCSPFKLENLFVTFELSVLNVSAHSERQWKGNGMVICSKFQCIFMLPVTN